MIRPGIPRMRPECSGNYNCTNTSATVPFRG
jgi:hypothetical protein